MKPQRILLAGWLGFMFFAYPGFMKSDAADMLADSRVGVFTGVHSPMMKEVWRLVGVIISGPAGMLVLQSGMLLLASYSLLRRIASDKTAAILAVVLLLFPPLMLTTALISPEAQLASFAVAAAALLPSERRWHRLVGLGLLVVSCGMRSGGALAVVPIILVGFRWLDSSRPRLVHYAFAVGAAATVVLLSLGINWAVVDVPNDREEVRLAMNDIVGSIAASSNLNDDQVRDALADVALVPTSDLQARARAILGKHGLYDEPEQGFFASADLPEQRDSIRRARSAIARTTPAGYLQYRWSFFKKVIGLSKSYRAYYTNYLGRNAEALPLGHSARHALLESYFSMMLRPLGKTLLFRPYLYLLVALVLIPFAIKQRQAFAMTLLASGILYEVAAAVAATRVEYRDSHWMIAATVLALIQVVVTRSRAA